MKWISKNISSIKHSLFPLNVVFVDNDSIDGTPDFIKNNFPEAHLIHNKKNLGFGRANNIGVKYAIESGAKYVFLLNQDAYLEASTISHCLLAFSLLQDNTALISPIHLSGSGEKLDVGFLRSISEELCPNFISDLVLGKLKKHYLAYSINAAGWLLKVEVIQKIGLFSELFFHYGEDVNFQQRLRYFGYHSYIVTNAFIYHDREERGGSKTKIGIKNEIKTNQYSLLLNINNSFYSTFKKLLKYAGLLIFQGKPIKGVFMVLDTLTKFQYYQNVRKQLKKGISL